MKRIKFLLITMLTMGVTMAAEGGLMGAGIGAGLVVIGAGLGIGLLTFAAANATIDFFVKNKVHLHIRKIGMRISMGWLNLAKKYNIKLKVSEFLPLCSFFFGISKQGRTLYFFYKRDAKKKLYSFK